MYRGSNWTHASFEHGFQLVDDRGRPMVTRRDSSVELATLRQQLSRPSYDGSEGLLLAASDRSYRSSLYKKTSASSVSR